MIVDGSTSTPRSCIISVRSRYEIPYLQYHRTHTKMISTGKRRRLNMNHRSAHELSVPVNATEPFVLHLMISLCPGCHARVHRTLAVLAEMPPLLLELWREQHPNGHKQTKLHSARSFPLRLWCHCSPMSRLNKSMGGRA